MANRIGHSNEEPAGSELLGGTPLVGTPLVGTPSVGTPLGAGATRSASSGVKARAGWSALRCAGLASMALAGCVVANVAGCGGGGGGSIVPTPQLSQAVIVLANASGQRVNGTVMLNNMTVTTTNNQAVFTNLRPGSYPLVFTVGGVTTRTTIAVSRDPSQTFVAVPGLATVNSNGIRVSGRTILNSPSDSALSGCGANSTPVTGPLVIRVRSLSQAGRPIVSSLLRTANADGRYVIFTIPMAGTYRVEASSADTAGAPFTGVSASFTINPGQTLPNLDICTNQSTTAPGGTPPPPPGTPTAGPGTPSATANTTQTPGANVTPGAPGSTPVNTVAPGATATPPAGGVPTSTPAPVPTNTPVPAATATPTVDPNAAPTPTPTTVGEPTAVPTIPTAGFRR